jgi:Protein of unknown function (DUF1761)
MPDINLLSVLVAATAAFAVGMVWYGAFGAQVAEARGQSGADGAADEMPPPWKLGVEFVRCLLVAVVLAGFASQGEIDEATGSLLLGVAAWVGFPLVLLSGSVLWEDVPPRLAALHVGDWLVKLLVVAVIVSLWQ